jgi:hypothetical protein
MMRREQTLHCRVDLAPKVDLRRFPPLNKPKRPLRSILEELAAELADAVLVAARESLFELAASESRPEPRRARVVRRPAPRARPAARPRPRSKPAPVMEAASDQLITDPQALLAALDTAGPEYAIEPREESPREEPEILRPVSVPAAPAPIFIPSLRAGEEIVRASGGGVVLRRRRV